MAAVLGGLSVNWDLWPNVLRFTGDGRHFAGLAGVLSLGHPVSDLHLSSLTPDIGEWEFDTQVAITGTGFSPGTRVIFDRLAVPSVTTVDPAHLSLTVPVSPLLNRVVDVFAIAPDGRTTELGEAFRFRGCDEAVWSVSVLPPYTLSPAGVVALVGTGR